MAGETFSTYDVVGIVEEVDDVISNLSPTETPFQSLIGKGKCDTTYVEWQEDSLRAAADNAVVEGADAIFVARTPTTMRGNRTQILADAFLISGTNERVKKYGRDSEIAYQTAKMGKQLKLDLELVLIGLASQSAVAGDETTTARRMANVIAQIDSSVTNTNAGTPRALTETLVVDITEKCYTAGANPSVLMIKPADAKIVADFAKATGRTREGSFSDRKIVNVVDVYVSPYGELKVVMNRLQKTSEAFAIDPDMWQLLTLRPWQREELAKTGDATRFAMRWEGTLKHKNFKGTGRIGDLS